MTLYHKKAKDCTGWAREKIARRVNDNSVQMTAPRSLGFVFIYMYNSSVTLVIVTKKNVKCLKIASTFKKKLESYCEGSRIAKCFTLSDYFVGVVHNARAACSIFQCVAT